MSDFTFKVVLIMLMLLFCRQNSVGSEVFSPDYVSAELFRHMILVFEALMCRLFSRVALAADSSSKMNKGIHNA